MNCEGGGRTGKRKRKESYGECLEEERKEAIKGVGTWYIQSRLMESTPRRGEDRTVGCAGGLVTRKEFN